jgi:hypothetical protein
MPSFSDAVQFLVAALRGDDLCLVMGAGNVDQLGRSLVGRAANVGPTGAGVDRSFVEANAEV